MPLKGESFPQSSVDPQSQERSMRCLANHLNWIEVPYISSINQSTLLFGCRDPFTADSSYVFFVRNRGRNSFKIPPPEMGQFQIQQNQESKYSQKPLSIYDLLVLPVQQEGWCVLNHFQQLSLSNKVRINSQSHFQKGLGSFSKPVVQGTILLIFFLPS